MRRILILAAIAIVALGAGFWLFAPTAQPGLVLYSAVDYGPSVASAFTKQTGIAVKVVQLSTGSLLARASAEGGHPSWSLVWFDGDEAAAALDQGGLLAHDVVPRVPWTDLGRTLIPADGAYAPTGVTLAGVFIRRTGSPGSAPARWSDLVAPALAGKVGMNNPTISGPTYPLVAGLLAQNGGWPGGGAFLVALKRNGLHVYPKNSNTLAALRAEEIDLAMTQSSAAWNAAAQAPGLAVTTPAAGFVLPSVIAVAAHQDAKAQAAARRFIAFAMSPAAQQLRLTKGGADSFYWPITSDAPPPRAPLPPLAALNLVRLDPNVWGRREAAVNTWFEKTVLGP